MFGSILNNFQNWCEIQMSFKSIWQQSMQWSQSHRQTRFQSRHALFSLNPWHFRLCVGQNSKCLLSTIEHTVSLIHTASNNWLLPRLRSDKQLWKNKPDRHHWMTFCQYKCNNCEKHRWNMRRSMLWTFHKRPPFDGESVVPCARLDALTFCNCIGRPAKTFEHWYYIVHRGHPEPEKHSSIAATHFQTIVAFENDMPAHPFFSLASRLGRRKYFTKYEQCMHFCWKFLGFKFNIMPCTFSILLKAHQPLFGDVLCVATFATVRSCLLLATCNIINGQSKSASENSEGGWGFYKDCEGTPGDSAYRLDAAALEKRETPDYVLEDTLEMQALWHATAGTRPAQPAHERKRMEEIWSKQIAESQACKDFQESTPIISNEKDVKILARDASPFGTSVTKSWRCEYCGDAGEPGDDESSPTSSSLQASGCTGVL